MGQGTDSLGGYEAVYEEREEGLVDAVWTTRDGRRIKVENMTDSHLKNTLQYVKELIPCAFFSCEADTLNEWVEIFEREIEARRAHRSKVAEPAKPKKPVRGSKVSMICHCGMRYEARSADIARGWALSCSKACAGLRRELKLPAAKPANEG